MCFSTTIANYLKSFVIGQIGAQGNDSHILLSLGSSELLRLVAIHY